MSVRDVDGGEVQIEECIGCGWTFTDGGKAFPVSTWDAEALRDSVGWVCEPCYHLSHSWRGGRGVDEVRRFVSMCTNLVLREIRNGRA